MALYKRLLLGILFLPLINANIVIDVRTPGEWSAGHLEGTKNIEWQDILNIKNSVNKDEEIYLYCRSGNRSGRATQILIDAGLFKCYQRWKPRAGQQSPKFKSSQIIDSLSIYF